MDLSKNQKDGLRLTGLALAWFIAAHFAAFKAEQKANQSLDLENRKNKTELISQSKLWNNIASLSGVIFKSNIEYDKKDRSYHQEWSFF